MKDDVYPSPSTPRAKMVFFIWKVMPRLVLVAMLLTIVFLFMAIQEKHESIAAEKKAAVSPEAPPVNSIVHPVHFSDIHERINLPGSIEAWTQLELMAKVAGTVDRVFVQEGDEVEKGQPLAELEKDDFQIALERAKAAYALAKADYERDRAVFKKGVIPVAELDAKKTAMLTAKADLDNARLQLSRCTITAPIDGIIQRLDAEEGLLLSVADPVARILKIDRVKAVVGIPESDVAAVRKLDEVDITIKALDGRVVTGKKHFLSPAPTTNARLFTLELAIDNSARDILPGMFCRADIVKKTVHEALTIPFYSVITRNDEKFVFVEDDNVAVKKNVELGIMEEWMVEVKNGLQQQDRLIIEGHRSIENGQKIKVVKVVNDLKEHTL